MVSDYITFKTFQYKLKRKRKKKEKTLERKKEKKGESCNYWQVQMKQFSKYYKDIKHFITGQIECNSQML